VANDRRVFGERGSAIVEFALVLPILLVVTLALVQVGLIVRDQLLVVQAARAGAREAAVQADETAIRQAALDAGPGLNGDRLDVSVQRSGSAGDPVTVDVTYDEIVAVPFVSWLFPPSASLHAAATMRQEFG